MSSLLKANWARQAGKQTGRRAQVSIGMHAHPKNLCMYCRGKNRKCLTQGQITFLSDHSEI
jgi:hypothetical protein